VAVAHVIFNVMGVLLMVGFIPQFAALVRDLSPASEHLVGMARLTEELPRQVANAHTLFNVAASLLFLPFTGWIATLCVKLLPNRPQQAPQVKKPRYQPHYLDDTLISTPAIALAMVRREMSHLADTVDNMLAAILPTLLEGDIKQLKQVRRLDKQVDQATHIITRYLSQMSRQSLSDETADQILAAMTVAQQMESIGDVIERNLYHLGKVAYRKQVTFQPETTANLTAYHDQVLQSYRAASSAYVTDNPLAARTVVNMEENLADLDVAHRARQLHRLQEGEAVADLTSYTIQLDIRESLKRIFHLSRRIARVEATGVITQETERNPDKGSTVIPLQIPSTIIQAHS
jgi:phosphate:Na+ symporter